MLQPLRSAIASRTWRGDVVILLFFAGLTALVTYPQVRWIGTRVPYSSDPYFSIWRLAWVAHAIVTNPADLFHANIFYPAPSTLGYSDAMLLPGIVTAPLFWAEINAVLIYNVAFLSAFVLSGWTMFRLALSLTASVPASIAAGIIFAFTPYRFCHYMHLELQLVFWVPVALLLVHRLIEHARIRDGVLLGLTMAAQVFSSIYMGLFAIVYLAGVTPVLLVVNRIHRFWRLAAATVAGALLAAALVAPYAREYRDAERVVGLRPLAAVEVYSVKTRHYLSAPAMNRLYGWTDRSDMLSYSEMNLFPGVLACVLAAIGVLFGPGRARFAYLAGLAVAIEMSRGVFSPIYLWLFQHFAAFQALRSPARFVILVSLSLAVLSAYGVAFLLTKLESQKWKRIMAAVIAAALIVEYASSPVIEPAPGPTRVDSFLSKQPPSIIVELPIFSFKGFWGSLDSIYMAQGIGHLQKMINGYSGYAPASFYQNREALREFPDAASLELLRKLRVDFIVVRAGAFERDYGKTMLEQLDKNPDYVVVASWPDGPQGAEAIYKIKN